MVITNSGSLFQNQGLLQTDGSLSERWGQQGSEVLNLLDPLVNSSRTIHTVTTGKTAYITQIITRKIGGDGTLEFRDELVPRFEINYGALNPGDISVYNFSTPLQFDTSIHLFEDGEIRLTVSLMGWEEGKQ